MKRVATGPDEEPNIVRIPQIVRVVIVRVKPQIIVVAVEVEQVGIAVSIGLNEMPSLPPPLEYSRG
jgi:hypothetical protein